ncbi:glycosyltransferase family 4 protein [Bacillus sp. FJAT-45350]|uniref:glycosyltransferase family 4 protein n=1 Tax=Bacillus sp. FJAT-45350 TaxID=2011014 RepID=UPI000BB6E2D8|nr:glycosyltransferase family 4 protein [Bacillus sp. FJAT-45350]
MGNVTFFSPYIYQPRGNSTTARRIIGGLEKDGLDVKSFAYCEEELPEDKISELKNTKIYHILHFRRFAEWQLATNFQLDKPYILTSGGTDVNQDLFQEREKEVMRNLVENASMITVFNEDAKDKLLSVYNLLAKQVEIVSQSIWFPENIQTNRNRLQNGYPKLLLPAGLREVKDVLYLIPAIEELQQSIFPEIQFTIIGAPLDEYIEEQVREAYTRYHWLDYIEDVPFEEMPAIYEQSDIVLNTSLSEGQPIALLEAMYCHKPVMARKIAGNESLIKDNVNGFIFDNLGEFKRKLEMLVIREDLRETFIKNGLNTLTNKHALEKEIASYKRIYAKCLHP